MVSSVSSTPQSNSIVQYQPVQRTQQTQTATKSTEDSVQLSAQAQQAAASSKTKSPASQPTVEQLVNEAANGDISALFRLAVVG
jgi:anti-sigma28 factor (negative regulator of flagellin synthesis)